MTTVELPFHATYINATTSTWRCNAGFFKTVPKDPLLATCKRCSSNILNATSCPADTAFIPCTPFQDAGCLPCDPLLTDAWIYAADRHDCSTKECNNGFYNDTASCLPCSIGSYCVKGERRACGENLTTLSTQESSPLSCIPSNKDAAWQIQVTFYFLTLTLDSSRENLAFCPLKTALISGWLTYGKLVDCTAATQADDDDIFLTSFDGKMNCIVITTKKYADEYLQWLDQEIEERNTQLIEFTQGCIQRNDIASWTLHLSSNPPDYFSSNISSSLNMLYSNKAPMDVPQLASSLHVHWGNSGHDVVIFVTAITIMICGICVSICLLITGFVLRFRRRKQRNTTHKIQMFFFKNTL